MDAQLTITSYVVTYSLVYAVPDLILDRTPRLHYICLYASDAAFNVVRCAKIWTVRSATAVSD